MTVYIIIMVSALVIPFLVTLVSFCILHLSGDIIASDLKHIIEADCKITDCVSNVSTCGRVPYLYTCNSMEFEYTLSLQSVEHHTFSQHWSVTNTTREQICSPIGTTVPCYYYNNLPIKKTLNIDRDITHIRGTSVNQLISKFVIPITTLVFFISLLFTVAVIIHLLV
jgi:hypothetical protein